MGEQVRVSDHAAEHLQFIRHTMERSATFTAVPGVGGVLMGGVGVAAAAAAALQPSAERWLAVWLTAAPVALGVGTFAMQRKAARLGLRLTGPPARRFALALAAPLVAGAALTFGLWRHGGWDLIPATWLLLYGAGVTTGGAFSVAPLRVLGVAFMACGIAALVTPVSWGNAWLGFAFGGLQMAFGMYIARNHGG